MASSSKRQFKSLIPLAAVLVLSGAVGISISVYKNRQVESHSTALALQGESLYIKHCASCHGENLEGQPNWKTRNENGRLPAPPHDETGHTWHHDDQLLFELTKFGMVPPNIPEGYESDMPAYEDILSDDEIWAVLYFIKSRWPEEIRKRQEDMSSNKSQFVKP